MNNKQSVAIIGLGYVGLPLALLTEQRGFKTIGLEKDPTKIDSLKRGVSYIDDVTDQQISQSNVEFTDDFRILDHTDVVVLCVPTPVNENKIPDLSIVEGAINEIAKHARENSLIIVESTINPGVCDEIIIPLIEKNSGYTVGRNIFLAHCPERINPGDEKWNVRNINRVVGANDKISLDKAMAFYESVIEANIKAMGNIKEAEAVKIVENSFRDINIAFVNELAMSFHSLGINVVNVIDGAATKPFSFMAHYPSIGVGGHCIPVDPYYMIQYAHDHGFDHKFLSLAREINEGMPEFVLDLLREGEQKLGNRVKRVTVLGLSYKPDVADLRESPALKLIDILENNSYSVVKYDPYFLAQSDKPNIESALSNSDCVIIATPHKQFLDYFYRLDFNAKFDYKVLIDGHNNLNKLSSSLESAQIIYLGIGTK